MSSQGLVAAGRRPRSRQFRPGGGPQLVETAGRVRQPTSIPRPGPISPSPSLSGRRGSGGRRQPGYASGAAGAAGRCWDGDGGEAVNGLEGVARAEAVRPDVVLMDYRMPGFRPPPAFASSFPRFRVVMFSSIEGSAAGCWPAGQGRPLLSPRVPRPSRCARPCSPPGRRRPPHLGGRADQPRLPTAVVGPIVQAMEVVRRPGSVIVGRV
jgi:hypothetical protein